MSINVEGVPTPVPTDVTPSPATLGFTTATHSISAASFIDTDVTATAPSLSFTPINASANNNVNAVPSALPSLAFTGLNHTIVGLPETQETPVNASAPTLTITPANADVAAVNFVGTKKWNPGHYRGFGLGESPVIATNISNRTGYYNGLASNPDVQGVALWFGWQDLEPTQGNYNWQPIWDEINYLKNLSPYPKRLWLMMTNQHFINRPNDHAYLPQWLIDLGGLVESSTGNGELNIWNPTIANIYAGFLEAMAIEFDGEPYLEIVSLNRETATGSGYPTFSKNDFMDNWETVCNAANAAFKKTNISLQVNWLPFGSLNDMIDLITRLRNMNPKVGVSIPDTAPKFVNNDINQGLTVPQLPWSVSVVMGEAAGGGVSSQSIGQPIFWRCEASELGIGSVQGTDGITFGKKNGANEKGGYVVQTIYDFVNDHIKASHFSWDGQEYTDNRTSSVTGKITSNQSEWTNPPFYTGPYYGERLVQHWDPAMLDLIAANPQFDNNGYPY